MAETVLDASAILAFLQIETGGEQVGGLISDALVSVVNEAEVISKLVSFGQSAEQALEVVSGLPYRLVDLDRQLARRAGFMWKQTKAQGLSFGDRCCLALAEQEGLPAVTADQRWANASIGIAVRLIR